MSEGLASQIENVITEPLGSLSRQNREIITGIGFVAIVPKLLIAVTDGDFMAIRREQWGVCNSKRERCGPIEEEVIKPNTITKVTLFHHHTMIGSVQTPPAQSIT